MEHETNAAEHQSGHRTRRQHKTAGTRHFGTAARLAGFLGTIGGAAALIGLAATGTGAYFTARDNGTVNANFGKVALSVNGVAVPGGDTANGANDLSITWNNMLPGTPKTVTYSVKNTGSAAEGIWLVFDNSNGGWGDVNQLGTYGDAKITSPLLTANFDNLNNGYAEGTPSNPGQHNACGDPTPAVAYLPAENHVANLNPGQSAAFTFSFGFSPCISNNTYQGQDALSAPLTYAIMATQQGIAPDDTHNGTGAYTHPTPPSGWTEPGWFF